MCGQSHTVTIIWAWGTCLFKKWRQITNELASWPPSDMLTQAHCTGPLLAFLTRCRDSAIGHLMRNNLLSSWPKVLDIVQCWGFHLQYSVHNATQNNSKDCSFQVPHLGSAAGQAALQTRRLPAEMGDAMSALQTLVWWGRLLHGSIFGIKPNGCLLLLIPECAIYNMFIAKHDNNIKQGYEALYTLVRCMFVWSGPSRLGPLAAARASCNDWCGCHDVRLKQSVALRGTWEARSNMWPVTHHKCNP